MPNMRTWKARQGQRVASCAVALCLLVPQAPLQAQSVGGVLVEEATGRAVAGAFMVLVDARGRDRAGTLADSVGRFVLRAPGAGRYRLRADRIGYESTLSAPFELASGESKTFRMQVSPAPVRLQGLVVESESRCRRRRGAGSAAYALWQEAKKALEATRWTEARQRYRYDVVSYRRALDVSGKRVLAERRDTVHYASRMPFRTLPAETLEQRGYVHRGSDTTVFYGPDAGVLLSDAFQESHCFGVERGKREQGEAWTGLSFKPIPGRKRTDIQGVLWLDEATAELRRVEFRYTKWRGPRALPGAGGEVEFERQATGEWIVPRWWIRTPLTRMVRRIVYGGVMEDGAYVTAVHAASEVPGILAAAPVERLEWPVALLEESLDAGGEADDSDGARLPAGSDTAATEGAASLPPAVVKALSVYRSPPDSGRVATLLREWQKEGEGLAGPRGRIAAAELWRRAGKVEQARAALGRAPRSGMRALWELERARIGFSEQPDEADGYREAEAALWRACSGLDGEVKAELWRDLRGLATPEEQVAWAVLPAAPSTCGWLRHYLSERAWRMGVSVGERLALHYRRLDHARRWYWLRRPRLQRDMADELGRPDSLEVDDRGLVYLRMGKPDRIAGWVPPGPEIHPNESWAYYRPTGVRFYHFGPVSKIGGESVSDYRLLRTLNEVIGTTLLDEVVEIGGRDDVVDLYNSRSALSGRFARLAHRFGQAKGLKEQRAAEATALQLNQRPPEYVTAPLATLMSDLSEEKNSNYRDARWVIQGVPDEPVVGGLKVVGEVLRFWNPDSEKWSVWLLSQAGGGGLKGRREEGGYRYEVSAELSLLERDILLTRRVSRELDRTAELGEKEGVTFRLPLQLAPGRYPYTLVVRDRGAGEEGRGAWVRDTLAVPDQGPELPAVSDLAVATDSGGSWTRDGRTYLKVTPSHVVGRTGALHVYFEVYGLAPGAAYELEFRLVREDEAERMYELAPGDVAFRLRSQGEIPSSGPPVGHRHVRLELGKTKPGRYVLGVRVRDEATGTESLPATTNVLVSGGSR